MNSDVKKKFVGKIGMSVISIALIVLLAACNNLNPPANKAPLPSQETGIPSEVVGQYVTETVQIIPEDVDATVTAEAESIFQTAEPVATEPSGETVFQTPEGPVEQLMSNEEIQANIDKFMNMEISEISAYARENGYGTVLPDGTYTHKFVYQTEAGGEYHVTDYEEPLFVTKLEWDSQGAQYGIQGILLGQKIVKTEDLDENALYYVAFLGHVDSAGNKFVKPYVYMRNIDRSETEENLQLLRDKGIEFASSKYADNKVITGIDMPTFISHEEVSEEMDSFVGKIVGSKIHYTYDNVASCEKGYYSAMMRIIRKCIDEHFVGSGGVVSTEALSMYEKQTKDLLESNSFSTEDLHGLSVIGTRIVDETTIPIFE